MEVNGYAPSYMPSYWDNQFRKLSTEVVIISNGLAYWGSAQCGMHPYAHDFVTPFGFLYVRRSIEKNKTRLTFEFLQYQDSLEIHTPLTEDNF